MQWETDRKDDLAGEPSLKEMTAFAIDLLSRNPQGYFLMVEAGRIDHGHHMGNAYRALTDTIAFGEAVRLALAKVDLRETLVIVTADHSHTLTIGGYPTRGNDILGLVVQNDRQNPGGTQLALDGLGKPYTTLGYQNGPGYTGASSEQLEGAKHFPHLVRTQSGIEHGRPNLLEVDTTSPLYLQESASPMFRESHGGEDVAVYAGGPGAATINGVMEQNDLYHAMLRALGWTGR
jgi:alkaline phosphatase